MRAFLILALALPMLAQAEDTWRWRDSRGVMHYSNVLEHAPAGAAQIGGRVGFLEGAIDEPDAKDIQESLADFQKLHEERTIRRRLDAIQAFDEGVRRHQRERLLAFSNVVLLSDWEVSDRWMELRSEQATLTKKLHDLEQGTPGS